MFERFTADARQVVVGAQEQARRLGHGSIGTEHLLLSMLGSTGTVADLLRARGVTTESAEAAVTHATGARTDMLTEHDAAALRAIGIDLDEVRARLEENFGPDPLAPPADQPPRRWLGMRRTRAARVPGASGHIPFSPRGKKVLELSLRESLRLGHREIRLEHVLLGLIREGEGLAALVLTRADVDLAELRRDVEATMRRAA